MCYMYLASHIDLDAVSNHHQHFTTFVKQLAERGVTNSLINEKLIGRHGNRIPPPSADQSWNAAGG